jgi:DNA-binding beta-propeller fold protein YncE
MEIPNTGWFNSANIPNWAVPVEIADFPHNLPDRPVALNNPNYQPWTSGRSLTVHNDLVFVVNTEQNNLVVLNRLTGKIQRIIAVGNRPEQVVVAPDGTAFVTIRYGGSVARIAAGAKQVSHVAMVGVEPYGLALSPNTQTLYVTLSGEGSVVALQAKDLLAVGTIETDIHPRSIAVNPQGDVYVTQQFGGITKILVNPMTGAPLELQEMPMRKGNPADFALHKIIGEGKAMTNIQTRGIGITVNPKTGDVYASHVQAQPGSEQVSLNNLLDLEPEIEKKSETACSTACQKKCKKSGGYGGSVCSNVCNTSCVTTVTELQKSFPHLIRPLEVSVSKYSPGAIVPAPSESSPPIKDKKTGEPMTALIDKPWDINHHPTHSMAFVVGKGTDNLLVLATNSKDCMRSTIAEIKVGEAPKAISFSKDGKFAYVLNSQAFTVSEIDLTPLFNMAQVSFNQAPVPGFEFKQFNSGNTLTHPKNFQHKRATVFGVDMLPEAAKLGRRTFTFARNPGLAFNGHFACSTCHFEGYEDNLVWFVSDGPRQTPILAGKIKGTEPFNWMGSASTLQHNFKATITRMGGDGLNQAELDSLEIFISDHLEPPPNPNKGEVLTVSQQDGKELFYHPEVGCSDCHAGEALTDGKNYDVGTASKTEQAIAQKQGADAKPFLLNTPSLKNLFYSAPYLHDGTASTLFDVLNITSSSMGHSATLTGQQQVDLVNYLMTL